MFESCLELVDEYSELERQLAVPEVHNDQELARSLGRRYAQLRAVVAGYREWASLADDVAAATELAADDESFAAELSGLVAREAVAADRLTQLLLPRDPLDDKDVIVEVKAGEGGEESVPPLTPTWASYLQPQGEGGMAVATWNARPTISGMRAGLSICATHLVISPK